MKNLNELLRRSCIPAVMGCLLSFAHSAHADRLDLSFYTIGPGSSRTGVLHFTGTADPTVPGAYDITALTGTLDGDSVTLLGSATAASPFVSSTLIYDNAFYFGINPFDDDGLYFSAAGNTYNLFGGLTNAGGGTLVPIDPQVATQQVVYTYISAVPEPGTLSLCGTAVLAFAGLARRRPN